MHTPPIHKICFDFLALKFPPILRRQLLAPRCRGFGVKRSMRGDEARRTCPELQLVQVPTANGKADIAIYRGDGVASPPAIPYF